jgi:hypothetical protein
MNNMQAKDITDQQIFDAITSVRGKRPLMNLACIWDIQEELGEFPPKVVTAKLRSMINRKLISGCVCGCRGDFKVIK